jgi:hypothetical protein
LAWHIRFAVFSDAFVPFLGNHQKRAVFSWAGHQSLPGNERGFYQSCMVHVVYDWTRITSVSPASGISKCVSNLWDQPQKMDLYYKRNRRFLFNRYLPAFCINASRIYAGLASVISEKLSVISKKIN